MSKSDSDSEEHFSYLTLKVGGAITGAEFAGKEYRGAAHLGPADGLENVSFRIRCAPLEEGFVRLVKEIVGEDFLEIALGKIHKLSMLRALMEETN